MQTVIYPVKDIAAAKELYGALFDVAPLMDEPYYVGFDLRRAGRWSRPERPQQGHDGSGGHWHVDDINETLEALLAAGAEVHEPVRDVGGAKLVTGVTAADGNDVGPLQAPAGEGRA